MMMQRSSWGRAHSGARRLGAEASGVMLVRTALSSSGARRHRPIAPDASSTCVCVCVCGCRVGFALNSIPR